MPSKGNPAWKKGGESPNPAGRGIRKAAPAAPGYDGINAYATSYSPGERSGALSGQQKWTTYANSYSHPAVAVSLLLRWALVSGIKWSLTPNKAGGPDADRGVDIVQQGLLEADMLSNTWAEVFAKAMQFWYNGASIHATALARRPDGVVVFSDISHRPMHTIDEFRREAGGRFRYAIQDQENGSRVALDLDDCLYLVNDAAGDAPDGVGVLRFVVEKIERIEDYEELEGSELFSSLGGLPIARAPLAELREKAGSESKDGKAYVLASTQTLRDAVGKRIKTPNIQQQIMLDSATYETKDGSPTGIKKWDIEIVKGDLQGLLEIRAVITDSKLDVARVLGVEFAFVGGGDAGSFGMHESKVTMFAESLNACVAKGVRAARTMIRRLVAANGLNPDTACPDLVPSPIKNTDVAAAVDAITKLQLAGLPPNHPAKKAVFERVDLPYQEESVADLMAPRSSGFGFGAPREQAVMPAESASEEPKV